MQRERNHALDDLPPLKLPNCECDGMLWTASLILLRHLEVSLPSGWYARVPVLELAIASATRRGPRQAWRVGDRDREHHEMAGGQAGYDSMVAGQPPARARSSSR